MVLAMPWMVSGTRNYANIGYLLNPQVLTLYCNSTNCIHIYICTHIWSYICLQINTYIYIQIHALIYIYIYVYVYVYMYIYIHAYIDVYIYRERYIPGSYDPFRAPNPDLGLKQGDELRARACEGELAVSHHVMPAPAVGESENYTFKFHFFIRPPVSSV